MSVPRNEVAELTAISRELWEQQKAGLGYHEAVETLPGFELSLRRLVEVHEYGDTDIGIMFGVCRERVRQWRNKLGIAQKRRGSGARIWDDALGRFVTMGVNECNALFARKRRTARQERKRRGDVLQVQRVSQRLGRIPTMRDVFPEFIPGTRVPQGYTGAAVRWGYGNGRSYEAAMDALWAAAGFRRADGRRVYARYGENATNSKLTRQEVIAIRQEYAQGQASCRTIGAAYGVSENCVWCVIQRRTWKHLP